MMDYETIKRMAKEQGMKVDDLLALAPKNDPFYTGRPAEVKAAEWFAELWRRFGYSTGVHLRRVHYRTMSHDPPILRPDGTAYENTDRCWKWLCAASQWARYLDLVDYKAFVDRRNPDAITNARWKNPGDEDYFNPTPRYGVWEDDWENELPELPELEGLLPELPELPTWWIGGYTYQGDPLVQQSYHVEVWCEKTTMNDVLGPLCRLYDANLITGAGEMSITSVVDFMERVRHAGRPARILYISDYDPAGLGMPISVARKVEFLQRHNGTDGLDIRLHPIVLTAEQVADYDLPRVPVKDTETRKDKWEERHGEGQVELDALEALHEGELADIVEAAILDYYDPDLDRKTREARQELRRELFSKRRGVLEEHRESIGDIETDYADLVGEVDTLRIRFAELAEPFREEIEAYQERLDDVRQRWQGMVKDLVDDLKMVDVDPDDYPLPEPDLPEENDGTLYVSGRDYLEQLEYYQAYREGQNQP